MTPQSIAAALHRLLWKHPPTTALLSITTSLALLTVGLRDYLYFDGHYAYPTSWLPGAVKMVVQAGNELQHEAYSFGGGHGKETEYKGFDCSGAVSYVLMRAGLLAQPLTSKDFAGYGASGPGQWVSLYVKPGEHVFMAVCGLRFDTSGSGSDGPRWRPDPRDPRGFQIRHPMGL